MGATIVERLAECAAMIEDLSQRISRIQTGEVQHQARFAGGSWEDITPEMLVLYERLLQNQTFLAEDLRGRLTSGDSLSHLPWPHKKAGHRGSNIRRCSTSVSAPISDDLDRSDT